MIKVELLPAGVMVTVECLYTSPAKIQELIDRLSEVKEQLTEHQARSAEEGYKDLWESE
jgi:hypothetical protein